MRPRAPEWPKALAEGQTPQTAGIRKTPLDYERYVEYAKTKGIEKNQGVDF